MSILIIILLLICLWRCSFSIHQINYLSKSKTNALKGVFVCLVFFSHLRGYIHNLVQDTYIINAGFDLVLNYLGQLIVVVYFFYSGYGIMEQYKCMGTKYLTVFPINRIFKTWLHFAIAVSLFIILQTATGHYFGAYEYTFCWIGWTSIGNSNWFVFDILVLYTLTYILLSIKERLSLSSITFTSCLLLGVMFFWVFLYIKRGGDFWWYDTIIVFPLGVLFSLLRERERIVKITLQTPKIKLIALLGVSFAFLGWRHFIGIDSIGICSSLFMAMVILLSTFISIDNPILQWLGNHLFSIYILQRIPMILLTYLKVSNPTMFIISAITLTLILASLFDSCLRRLDSIYLKKIFLE